MDPEVTETVEAAAETPEVVETPEVSDDDAMGDIYDQMTTETPTGPDRDESGRFVSKNAEEVIEGAVEAVEIEEEVNEATDGPDTGEATKAEAPSYLPHEVREDWANIPEKAREAFAKSQQEMSAKLGEAGRRAQGYEPIAQVIEQATQQFPELMNQTPQQIAQDVASLAQTRVNLQRDPVGTLMQVAQEMGVADQLASMFNGQIPATDPQMDIIRLQQANSQMQQQLQNVNNPANIAQAVSQEIASRDATNEVTAFAASKEHWQTVEPALPKFIPAAQQLKGAGASNADVLAAAYDMAINAYGLKATGKTSATAQAKTNPRRTEAVIKAKSANVTSSASKASPMTEMDSLGSAYDRMMSS